MERSGRDADHTRPSSTDVKNEYFMGFEFIFSEKAQHVRLQIQLLWIASQENSTY